MQRKKFSNVCATTCSQFLSIPFSFRRALLLYAESNSHVFSPSFPHPLLLFVFASFLLLPYSLFNRNYVLCLTFFFFSAFDQTKKILPSTYLKKNAIDLFFEVMKLSIFNYSLVTLRKPFFLPCLFKLGTWVTNVVNLLFFSPLVRHRSGLGNHLSSLCFTFF